MALSSVNPWLRAAAGSVALAGAPAPASAETPPAGLGGAERAAASITLPAGPRHLVWSDEFDTDGPPDPARWGAEQGFVRNRELQYFTDRPPNARVEGGLLILEAHRETVPNAGHDPAQPDDWRRARPTADYTSASLRTRDRAAWTYGRLEVRARVPGGRGVWPAIWTLGTNIREVGWPHCGEIDLMEAVGHRPGRAFGTIHTGAYNHVRKTQRGAYLDLPDLYDAFHVFSADWEAGRIVLAVDDRPYFEFRNEGTGPEAWPFDAPQFLCLTLAIGGTWGGEQGVDDTVFPVRLEVDYVRVYAYGPPPAAP